MEFQFGRYDTEQHRGIADEQIRAFVGEPLAELPSDEIDQLSPDERALYDRVLLRCEFANQAALEKFAHFATPESIEKTRAADAEVVAAARGLVDKSVPLVETLRLLDQAFDKREKAMQGQ